MFTRYHDPEIFVQTLDGIDRSNHIVATYFMDDELPGEDFIDHFALIQSIAIEGSTGSWERVEEETEEVRRRLSGKMVGYYEVPTGNPSRRIVVEPSGREPIRLSVLKSRQYVGWPALHVGHERQLR